MQRRHFFQLAGASAVSGFMPSTALSALADRPSGQAPNAWMPNPRLTYLRGYQGQDVRCERAWVEGRVPGDLRGVFYRNGPGLFERAGQRYQHWFDGDGMVHAWRFTEHGVSHHARFVKTKKFVAEQAAGEFLVPAFGTAIPAKLPVRSPDAMNTANTSVIQLDGQLYALWEGGSAHRMNAQTLDTEGLMAWAPELAGMPFSAHPKVEPDVTVWNFGTMMGKLVLYQISAQAKLLRHQILNLPTSAMVHDFAVSKNYLIFLLPPMRLNMDALRNGKSMVEGIDWRPEEATKVLVIDKSDWSRTHVFELPAMMLFHFGNAWDAQGQIRVDFVKTDNIDNFKDWMPRMMRGEDVLSTASTAAFLQIDLAKKSCNLSHRQEVVEFPRIDPRWVGQKNRYLFYPVAVQREKHYAMNGVMRLDVETGQTSRFDFGGDCSLEEHVLVPKQGARKEGEAWLVGVGFDIRRQTSFASVFDAENLAAGPVALAHLPYWTPHCFHGHFYT